MVLHTYRVQIKTEKGITTEEVKAENDQALIAQYEMLGYEPKQLRILAVKRGVPETADDEPSIPLETGNIQMISLDDIPEEMREQVAKQMEDESRQQVRAKNAPPVARSAISPKDFTPVRLWTDGNNEYKLENGHLFKKTWNKTNLTKLLEMGIRINLRIGDEKLKARDFTVEIEEWTRMDEGNQ